MPDLVGGPQMRPVERVAPTMRRAEPEAEPVAVTDPFPVTFEATF